MARTQLEELVKNLDSELVMDVVAKKMFDNFSMWQLESKRLALHSGGERGIGKMVKLFEDMEFVLGEVKKLVDACLTDDRHPGDHHKPTEELRVGEFMQSALSLHEGPWYLEQEEHIDEKFHKLLGIQASVLQKFILLTVLIVIEL